MREEVTCPYLNNINIIMNNINIIMNNINIIMQLQGNWKEIDVHDQVPQEYTKRKLSTSS